MLEDLQPNHVFQPHLHDEQTEMMHSMLDELQALQLKHEHIGHVYAFTEIRNAIHLFQKGETVGKVVVTIP